MIIKIEEVDEKKWPRSVRKALNELIRLRNRVSEIRFGNVQAPKWEQAENGEVITLPNAMASSLSLPWACSLALSGSTNIVRVREGRIFPELDNPDALDLGFTWPVASSEVTDGSKIMLKIVYGTPGDITAETDRVFSIEVSDAETWGDISLQEWETDTESDDYDMQTIGRIPLCEVSEVEGTLVLTQIARSDWWLSTIAFSGRLADWPAAL